MSTRTHVFIVLVAIVAVFLVLRLVTTRQLRSKYALIWLCVAAAIVALAIFPGALDEAATITGIAYTPTLFLIMALGLVGFLVGHLTWEVSRLEMRVRTLAEDNALLRNLFDEQLGDGSGDTPRPGPAPEPPAR